LHVQAVPRMAVRAASAHANKIRANGRRLPSSDRSTPNAPGSGPGRTRLHFHYTHLSPLWGVECDNLCLSVTDSVVTYHPLLRVPKVRKQCKLTTVTSVICCGIELDDIDNNLPHSAMVRHDHDLFSEGDGNHGIQEVLAYSPVMELVPATPVKKVRKRSNKG